MESQYQQTFKHVDFTETFNIQEYELCRFIDCNFEGVKLGDRKFIDCIFEECNLSSANVHMTALRNIEFTNCKMIGIRFDHINTFGFEARFRGCKLDYCIFIGMDLRKVEFENCSMLEVDFSDVNLSNSTLKKCNLDRSRFDNTDLSNADIRGSIGFQINPSNNMIHKMRISRSEIEGLLTRFALRIE